MKRKQKIASLLAVTVTIVGTSFYPYGNHIGNGISLSAQAGQENWASRSEAKKKASPSQAERDESVVKASSSEAIISKANRINQVSRLAEEVVDGEEMELTLYTSVIRPGTKYVQYALSNCSSSRGLQFVAERAGEEPIKLSHISSGSESGIIGRLETGTLKTGIWRISAVIDEEIAGEAELKVEAEKETITFTSGLSKKLGESDPQTLYSGDFYRINESGEINYNPLRQIKLEREAGETAGSYKITGVTDTQYDVYYPVEQNEFAVLQIEKFAMIGKKMQVYLDANQVQDYAVDIFEQKDTSDQWMIPRDIQNMKVALGQMGEDTEKNINGQPGINESTVKLQIKLPVMTHKLSIPLTVSSDNYQDFLFVIDIQADYLQKHTEEEIRSFYSSHPFNLKEKVTYAERPSFSPYTAGRISVESEEDGLNALNFVRYIAGIDADVKIQENLVEMAQAGAVLNAKNQEQSHYPDKPEDMDEKFYELAYKGTSSSNLCHGSRTSISDTIRLYMEDSSEKNIDRVGHRRWCLNPSMGYTGFGYCNKFYAMYALDKSNVEKVTAGYVSWPGRMMPYEYFEGPWSISFNETSYLVDEDVKVTLTRESGETLTFSEEKTDGYFSLDYGGYGMGPAVIFQPSASLEQNETIQVHVEGLRRPDGTDAVIDYTVKFFEMSESSSSGGSSGSSSSGNSGSSSSGNSGSSSSGSSGGSSSGSPGGSSSGNSGGSSGGSSRSSSRTGTAVENYGPGGATIITTGVYANPLAWIYDGIYWQLLTLEGTYAAKQWALVDGKWYIFDENGRMLTGWQNVDYLWYYMYSDGSMATGWIYVDNKWYCLAPNGAMYASTTTPDGYQVDASGAWIVP